MVKKNGRAHPRSRACSESGPPPSDDGKPPPNKRRKRRLTKDGTIWVDDDTLDSPPPKIETSSDEDDSDYNPEEDETEVEELIQDEEFISFLLKKYVACEEPPHVEPPGRPKREKLEEPPIKLSKAEKQYYDKLSVEERKVLLESMKRVANLSLEEGEVPHKFRVLKLPIDDHVKSAVIKKIGVLNDMGFENGEAHKLRNWIDAFMRIPFGKVVPLPVSIYDGTSKCAEFMANARKTMDTKIYGMEEAKLQIMQSVAQWIVNPKSIGNVIALHGPPGVGKTSFAKNAIADVLQRPFEFFTLGGASDIANFIGHSYTYEGSIWGRIADSLMHAGTMNPVMYFDELDKVSNTPHGEDIVSMMIHMTDRSQNSEFHDRYFAGVNFDLSQCLFVFSFNDMDKVHPILRDRMTVIHCGGYNEKDKTAILKDYIWPQVLERLNFNKDSVKLSDSAIKYMITEFSTEEKGVRNLIRTVESVMNRINMLRVSKHESMKDYKFLMEVEFPLTITEDIVKKMLYDASKKEPETWRSLYN